jgi:hypothetical protein
VGANTRVAFDEASEAQVESNLAALKRMPGETNGFASMPGCAFLPVEIDNSVIFSGATLTTEHNLFYVPAADGRLYKCVIDSIDCRQ